mgnify:CR=1 FL=1
MSEAPRDPFQKIPLWSVRHIALLIYIHDLLMAAAAMAVARRHPLHRSAAWCPARPAH